MRLGPLVLELALVVLDLVVQLVVQVVVKHWQVELQEVVEVCLWQVSLWQV